MGIIQALNRGTNPNYSNWVAGVLSLVNIAALINVGAHDPAWIEGGSSFQQSLLIYL